MVKLIGVMLPIGMLFIAFLFYWSKRISLKLLFAAIISIVLTSILGWSIGCRLLADIKPIITLTVQGANPQAEGKEIWLYQINADKKRCKETDIINGTWLNEGNILIWRSYRTAYQQTNSIDIRLPSADDYELVFSSNIWRGLVSISYSEQEDIVVDCYRDSKSENKLTVPLSFSGISCRTDFMIVFLVTIISCFILFVILAFFFYKIISAHQTRLELFCSRAILFLRNNYNWVIAIYVVLLNFALLSMNSHKSSLWSDDLAQIHYAAPPNTFSQMINKILFNDPTTPPLMFILQFVWFKIVPYGTFWLRLPSIVLYCISILLSAKLGNMLSGKKLSVLYAIFAGSSYFIMVQSGYSLRPYALFLICSFFALLQFSNRIFKLENLSRKDNISYSLSILLLLYSHYFGIFICVAFFATDFMLAFFNKAKFKLLQAYILPAMILLPWLTIGVITADNVFETFWPPVPTLTSMLHVIKTLSGIQGIFLVVLLLTIIYTCCRICNGLIRDETLNKIDIVRFAAFLVIVLSFLIVYVYSAYLRPDRSVFTARYFIGVFPMSILLISSGIEQVLALIETKFIKSNMIFICIYMAIFIVLGIQAYPKLKNEPYILKQNYEFVADYVYGLNDAHREDALTVVYCHWIFPGFDYYYTHGDRRPAINVSTNLPDALREYKYIFINEEHTKIPQTFWDRLDKEQFALLYKHPDYNLWIYERK